MPFLSDSGNPSRWTHYRATLRYSIPRNLCDVGANSQKIKVLGVYAKNCGRRNLAPLEYQYWLGIKMDNHLCAKTYLAITEMPTF